MISKFHFSTVALGLLFAFASSAFAEDIIAKTSNGSTVILHDNGRWEYYQNNSQIRDIRPEAIPEDAKFEVSVLYENIDKLKKNKRMMLEAEFATEEEIKDSLRALPKGGIIYFQVPTKQIKAGMSRTLTYSVYDKGKTPIFTKTVSDTEATPSEDGGISNLLVVPVYGKPKTNMMKAVVESNDGRREAIEIDIPIK